MHNKNSRKGFKYAVISLVIIFFIVFVNLYMSPMVPELAEGVISVMALASILIATIGFYHSIKGLKEPKSIKKIAGLILNAGMVIMFIALVIANIMDMAPYFL